jgi:MORN repeat.
MKKTKRISLLLTVLLLLPVFSLFAKAAYGTYKVGDVINEAVYSDVSAQINFNKIASYNINGNTAICVEDLEDYGFQVQWDIIKRSLTIGKYNSTYYVKNQMIYIPNEEEIGTIAYDVLFSDIKTYVFGKQVESFNINGRTMIYIDSISPYGTLNWDEINRKIVLNTTEHKEVKALYYDSGKVKYYGEVSYDTPNGYGTYYKITGEAYYIGGVKNDHFDGLGYYQYPDDWTYFGDWSYGVRSGIGAMYDENDTLRYWGDWSNDEPSGEGTSYNNHGMKIYSGEWLSGEYYGTGTLYDGSGNVIKKGYFRGME